MEKKIYESLNKPKNKIKIMEKYELLYKVDEKETHLRLLGKRFLNIHKFGYFILKNKQIRLTDTIETKKLKMKELKIYLIFYSIIFNKTSMFEDCKNLLKCNILDVEDGKNSFQITNNNDGENGNDFEFNLFDDYDEKINCENALEQTLNDKNNSPFYSQIDEEQNNFSPLTSLNSIKNNLDININDIYNQYFLDQMFFNCSTLIELPDIYKWNYKNIKSMNSLFYNCSSLTSLPDISKWDISNVINIGGLFYNCSSLTYLPDISKWDTSNVINIGGLFYNCSSLTSLPDISKWNTSKITIMEGLFYNCSS